MGGGQMGESWHAAVFFGVTIFVVMTLYGMAKALDNIVVILLRIEALLENRGNG
jgi:hypothetical protein